MMYMKKIDELIASNNKLAELLGKKEEPEKKCCNTLVWVLAIVGAIAAVAGIAYAVYRYMNQDCFDDFDFEDDDFEDDFEDEEEEEVIVVEDDAEETTEETTETE